MPARPAPTTTTSRSTPATVGRLSSPVPSYVGVFTGVVSVGGSYMVGPSGDDVGPAARARGAGSGRSGRRGGPGGVGRPTRPATAPSTALGGSPAGRRWRRPRAGTGVRGAGP